MVAVARTFTLLGVEARPVEVELDVGRGLPAFSIVGLPDAAVRESRERVRTAIERSGFKFPQQRITANLAPADLRKVGPGFDLAIAAALLAASDQLPARILDRFALAGELGLDGSIRPVPGALPMAEAAGSASMAIAVAPPDGAEAAIAAGVEVVPVARLAELHALGDGEVGSLPRTPLHAALQNGLPDLSDLRGQPVLRRALEIAAAGGHGILMIGPPGAGKTLAALRLPSLLPALAGAEALEAARIASACGRRDRSGELAPRPFRAPHHTISPAGLVGGGNPPRPGEVTLAHRGVLFLDELPEFSRPALEALRQPLEEGRVAIARAGHRIELPCRFQLVAAANPCPCGRGESAGECECPPAAVRRYGARLSGALADRIDLCLSIEQPPPGEMAAGPGEASAVVRDRVAAARERQQRRLGDGRCNAEMTPEEVDRHCLAEGPIRGALEQGARLGLGGRGYDRVLKVARTIADLADRATVSPEHLGEALTLRRRAGKGLRG